MRRVTELQRLSREHLIEIILERETELRDLRNPPKQRATCPRCESQYPSKDDWMGGVCYYCHEELAKGLVQS